MLRLFCFAVILSYGFLQLNNTVNADLVFNISEGSGVVDVAVSGSLNLDATRGFITTENPRAHFLEPADGAVSAGALVGQDTYSVDIPFRSTFPRLGVAV